MKDLIIKSFEAHVVHISANIPNETNKKHFDYMAENIIYQLKCGNFNLSNIESFKTPTFFEQLLAKPYDYQNYALDVYEEIYANLNTRFVTGVSKTYIGLFNVKIKN